MANTNAPFGLVPVRYRSGAPYNGARTLYHVPASDTTASYFIGTLVRLTGGADANGIPDVTGSASTGLRVIGPIVEVLFVEATSTIYRANSTERYVYVADDPALMFMIQEDASGPLAATAAGATCTLTAFATGSTVTGLSSTTLLGSGLSETSDTDDDVRIHQVVQAPNNEIGNYCRWLVSLNCHQFIDSGIGV